MRTAQTHRHSQVEPTSPPSNSRGPCPCHVPWPLPLAPRALTLAPDRSPSSAVTRTSRKNKRRNQTEPSRLARPLDADRLASPQVCTPHMPLIWCDDPAYLRIATKKKEKTSSKHQSKQQSRADFPLALPTGQRSHMTRPAHTRNRASSPACASSMVGRERSVRQLAAWTGGLFWFVHGLTNPSGHPTPFDPRLPPSSIPFLSTAPRVRLWSAPARYPHTSVLAACAEWSVN